MTNAARPTCAEIEALYDQDRFLDAYVLTRHLWADVSVARDLSPEELVMGGRLARTLGGEKTRRWLFRLALEKEPDNARVRCYTLGTTARLIPLIELLRSYEARPELGSGDPDMESSWMAWWAMVWASVRDFSRARELLERAKALNVNRAWVLSSEANVLFREDRWEDCLAVAEEAWTLQPTYAPVARALGDVLTRMGRLEETVRRLTEQAVTSQSHEYVMLACWYLSAWVERMEGGTRGPWLDLAARLSARLPELMPLADRDARSAQASCCLDVADLRGDRDGVRKYAGEIRSAFYRQVLANWEKNPAGRKVILPYRAEMQKYNTCLPASLVSVLGGFGVDLDAGEISRELTHGGTAEWRLADWLAGRGFRACPFLLTPETAKQLLLKGLPFVMTLGSESSSHAVAVVGYDEAADTMIIHDPSTPRYGEMIRTRVNDEEGPLGPLALAVVPAGKEDLLALIPRDSREPAEAFHAYYRAMELQGLSGCGSEVEKLAASWPGHPMTRYLQALFLDESGEHVKAFELLQGLMREHPNALSVRRSLMRCCSWMGNTAVLREVLKDVVERGILPGRCANQAWRYPPTTYLCQYADQLRGGRHRVPEAQQLLRKAILRDPFNGEGYHILGDLHYGEGQVAESLLPFRVASFLQEEHEHYAASYADALQALGREEDGFRFLQERVDLLGKRLLAAGVWVTLVQSHEKAGQPDRAAQALRQAEAAYPKDGGLQAFSAAFWVRYGDWACASDRLERLRTGEHRIRYLQAAVVFYRRSGEWEKALPLCEEWLGLVSDSSDARNHWLALLAMRDGRKASLERARTWSEEREGNDDLEYLHYQELQQSNRSEEAESLLERRVKRNAEDAWAWRELGHKVMDQVEQASPEKRKALAARLGEIRAVCARTCPDHAGTLGLEARWNEYDGRVAEALALFFRAVEVEPAYLYGYRRLWRIAGEFPLARQREVQQEIEAAYLKAQGRGGLARDLAGMIAERFGLAEAEAAVGRWAERPVRQTEIVKARGALWLEHGQGRTSATQAAALLESAIRSYPDDMELRFLLVDAYIILLRPPDAIGVLREILRRYPAHGYARRRLSQMLVENNESEEALSVLETGIRMDPLDESLRLALASFYRKRAQPDAAVGALESALAKMPESVFLRENLIQYLLDFGRTEQAVEAARAGTAQYPEGAYLWYLLGTALEAAEVRAQKTEIEKVYRKAIALNASLFEAADALAVLLTRCREYDAARELMKGSLGTADNRCGAQGRLAWISRMQKAPKAVAEMEEVLALYPNYSWGWYRLMDWLEEDEAWTEAKTALATPPPAILNDSELRARRLQILTRAGLPEEDLSKEWDQLLHDFPRNQELHLHRFDELWDREDKEKADGVLAMAERYHGDSPYVLARRIRVQADRKKKEEALQTALKLWTFPGSHGPWPDNQAWEALQGAGWLTDGVDAARAALGRGERLRAEAFAGLAKRVTQVERSWRREGLGCYLPDLRRQKRILLGLLKQVDTLPGENADYRAQVIYWLDEIKCYDAVRRYWTRNHERLKRQTAVWQQVGHSLVVSKPAAARQTLACWRDMPGVEMYAVYNYLLSLRRQLGTWGILWAEKENLAEIFASGKDALETLTHDWTAKAVACTFCEAALRLRRDDVFLAAVERYRPYIADENREQKLLETAQVTGTAKAIPLFEQMMTATDPGAIRDLTRQAFALRGVRVRQWVRREWLARVKGRLPGWRYGLLRLRAWVEPEDA